MNQYPTIDRWYAITILCLNVVFLVVSIFAARRAAKTEADAPEVLRKHHRVVLWAGMAGFTLIATVPAVLTCNGVDLSILWCDFRVLFLFLSASVAGSCLFHFWVLGVSPFDGARLVATGAISHKV